MKQISLTENKVHETTEYDAFKRLAGNRIVDTIHVNRLKKKMMRKDLKVPIIINSKAEIIDGQHRLEARRQLKLPVYYTVNSQMKIEDAQMANATTKNWSLDDYLHTYTELNFSHYKRYQEFKKKYGFGHTITSVLLSDGIVAGQLGYDEFTEGAFIVKNLKQGEEWAEKLIQIKPYYKGYGRRSFVLAMIKLFRNTEYNHDEFIKKLSYQSTKLVDCTGIPGYLRIIEDIYNYKRNTNDKVRFI